MTPTEIFVEELLGITVLGERVQAATVVLTKIKYYARNRDEEGFKEFLTEKLGMGPDDERYAAATSAFWNLVRSLEREPPR